MRLLILTSTALLFASSCAWAGTMTSGRPSAVLTKSQCRSVWKQASPHGHALMKANAAPYIVNFKLADGPDQDGQISKSEFFHACSKGLVKYTNH